MIKPGSRRTPYSGIVLGTYSSYTYSTPAQSANAASMTPRTLRQERQRYCMLNLRQNRTKQKGGQIMSGIHMLEERLKGLFPDLLGIQFFETTTELVTARLQVRPDLCTVGGILHGGAIMAFADTLGAIATVLNLPPDARTATIESKTNFRRPAPAGSHVIGECTALHRGKSFMTWQTRVTTDDGKLVAFVVQTQAVLS